MISNFIIKFLGNQDFCKRNINEIAKSCRDVDNFDEEFKTEITCSNNMKLKKDVQWPGQMQLDLNSVKRQMIMVNLQS